MDQYKDSFSEEALEVISEMEKCLLLMETNKDDSTLIQQVFRAMHTLKGNSAMFGNKVVAEFTHHLESIYEYIRSGQKAINKEILDVTFESLDHLSYLVANDSLLDASHTKTHQDLTARVIKIVKEIGAPVVTAGENSQATVTDDTLDTGNKDYHIYFAPSKEIFYNGTNPLHLLEEIKTLGECEIVSMLSEIPTLEEIDPTHCYTSWDIHLATSAKLEAIKQIFVFAEGRCELRICQKTKAIEPVLIEDFKGEESNLVTSPEIESTEKKNVISSIRVPSERIDNLMSLVSELMTLQAKLGMFAESSVQPEFLAVSENLEKISARLRDTAFSMCLIPIRNMITPFNRLVRDLANGLNKEIEFIAEGTDTELDKNIMEGLADPLMHLLRNSIDHGIEAPEVREQSCKKRKGTILLKAFCAGTNVYIEIKDDGKGIDAERIRLKAVQKGIIGKDEVLSEKEIFNLIFLPGFSTAEQISEISGRGVGMDVVKRKIEDIRGQIKISSQVNIGTTITIKLPITISIIDGLLVKVNNVSFVIPLSSIDRCFEAPAVRQLNRINNLVILDDEQIPFICLSEEFDGVESFGSQEIVMVYYEERKVALVIDSIVGKFQAVLKPLGRYFQQMDYISGATILGDGEIALVLDTNKVVEKYLQKKKVAICQ